MPEARPEAVEQLIRAIHLDESKPAIAYALQKQALGDRAPLVAVALIRLLWDEVVRETPGPEGRPEWIERWLSLEPSGFPIIDVPALRRLIEAKADLEDLTDVVRSAQVLALWNVVNLVDDPAALLASIGAPAAADLVSCGIRLDKDGALGTALGSLHEQFGDFDPSARHMEPRSPVLRRFAALALDVQKRLVDAITPGRSESLIAAAKIWAEHTHSSLEDAHAAVKELKRRRSLPMFDPLRPERAKR